MKNATMIYKCPGKHKLHGFMCDYKTVEAEEVESYIKEKGWSKTPTEAHEKLSKKETVEEVQQEETVEEVQQEEPKGFLGEEPSKKGRKKK